MIVNKHQFDPKNPAYAEYLNWVDEQPECVQHLAVEFPVLTEIIHDERSYRVCGYTEDDMLIVIPYDPAFEWDEALASRRYLCVEHVRQN